MAEPQKDQPNSKPFFESSAVPTSEKEISLVRTGKKVTPAETLIAELQLAYSYFNEALFKGELPDCMLTIDYSGRTILGYYKPLSFVSKDGILVDQISINPKFLISEKLSDVLSTLVHEMAHLWIFNIGNKKTINGYHCKKWVAKMEEIGLIPSNTGKPGGKKTGYQMDHYILAGGRFDRACEVLFDKEFQISWGMATAKMVNDFLDGNGSGKSAPPEPKDKSKGKVKFVCPVCAKPAWAAESRKLICGDHKVPLMRVTK